MHISRHKSDEEFAGLESASEIGRVHSGSEIMGVFYFNLFGKQPKRG